MEKIHFLKKISTLAILYEEPESKNGRGFLEFERRGWNIISWGWFFEVHTPDSELNTLA